jgi:hypothetical protein
MSAKEKRENEQLRLCINIKQVAEIAMARVYRGYSAEEIFEYLDGANRAFLRPVSQTEAAEHILDVLRRRESLLAV